MGMNRFVLVSVTAEHPYSEVRLQQHSGGDRRREGGRKSGTKSTDSPFSSSAVSEGGDGVDRVVSSAEVLPHHCFSHLTTIIVHILVFVSLLEY